MKIKKVLSLCVFLYVVFFIFGQQKNIIKYSVDKKIRVTPETKLEIEELKKNNELVSKYELKALHKYSPIQVMYIMTETENKILFSSAGHKLAYFEDLYIEKNGMKLYKALLFQQTLSGYSSGICFYINIDDFFRLRHCYIGNEKYEVVFDEDGKSYLIQNNSYESIIYKFDKLDIEYGSVYGSGDSIYINYINKDTKQVEFYKLNNGKQGNLKGLPPLYNPILFYGLYIENPVSLTELAVKPIESNIIISQGVISFNDVLMERHPSGAVYRYDTIYLIDYDFDGSRKKGVYKIMGDTWEFYPDL